MCLFKNTIRGLHRKAGGKVNELKIDEELKTMIPPLSTDEFEQLKQNIISDGCREPLVVWNGTIVDGHNRYQICCKHEIQFETVEKDFENKEQAVEWVIKNQFGRRNLSIMQRSELALKLKSMIQEKAKDNQKLSEGRGKKGLTKSTNLLDSKVSTRKEVSKIAGVGEETIYKAERILNQGTPEQIDRARTGGKGNSVNAVYKEIKSTDEGSKESSPEEIIKKDVEEKECPKCRQMLPLNYFYDGRKMCKSCYNDTHRSITDLKGNTIKASSKYKNVKEEDVIGDLYNVDRVIVYDINDLIAEFSVNFKTYARNLELILEQHGDLLKNKADNKKIMVVLSEAVTTMQEMKGKYLYE